MAQVIPADFIHELHGKMSGKSNGYFYMSKKTGKMYFRSREEGYQKNQSPRQKWNSAAFAYAHKQLHAIESDIELTAQMNAEYNAAKGKAPNGITYTTAYAWKFNSLLYEWKTANPFEG
jgi:hypothetical protein